MNREQAIQKSYLFYREDIVNNYNKLIDQIYNDHEAELQSEYRRLEGRDFMLSEMQKELEAKDDEIRRLNNLYADNIKDLGDALIEIERLKEHIAHLQNVYMKLDGKYLKLKTELEELKDNQ